MTVKIPRFVTILAVSALAAGFLQGAQRRKGSISVAIPRFQRYSGKEMRVHRFLWNKWRRRQPATAELTVFAIDTGNIFTVRIQQDSTKRWMITEHVRHYSALPRAPAEPTKLLASGTALHRVRVRNGTFVVRLVTEPEKTVPLFEYLD